MRLKEPPFRSRAYLKHVAELGCLICRQPAQAHHLLRSGGKGMSMKAPDNHTIPLCPKHHDALHASGDETGWLDMCGVDGPERANRIYTQWLRRRGVAAMMEDE